MSAAAALAAPFCWLYGAATGLRNRYYDRPGIARRAGLPVISVGNLTVGGTGKTPLVAWICRRTRALGLRPFIVSRGYGGDAGRGPLVVSDGGGPSCAAERCGDEPFLLARELPGVGVIVGSDRIAGAVAAAERKADVVVLDDGFQHRRLARDLDLVLLDATDLFGGGRLLPAGRLRESPAGLRRADLVLVTRVAADADLAQIEMAVRRYNAAVPVIGAGHRPVGFVDAAGRPVASPRRAVAFCGIGNPGRFRRDLDGLGLEVTAFRTYRDHHRYTAAELDALRRLSRDREADLVTTEKDLVRLPAASAAEVLALRIEAVVHRAEPLLEALRRLLRPEAG